MTAGLKSSLPRIRQIRQIESAGEETIVCLCEVIEGFGMMVVANLFVQSYSLQREHTSNTATYPSPRPFLL